MARKLDNAEAAGVTDVQHLIDKLQQTSQDLFFESSSLKGPPSTSCTALCQLVIQELEMLKSLTRQALLKQTCDSRSQNENRTILTRALRLWWRRPAVQALLDVGVLDGNPNRVNEQNDRRHGWKNQDTAAVHQLDANCFPNAQPAKLKLIIEELHAIQEDMLFQADMALCIQRCTSDGRWTEDNFAYGSTPFHSWLSVLEHPQVKPHVSAAVQHDGLFQVWGSSIGWLVFYAALTYGINATGVELLECHVTIAQALAESHKVSRVFFLHQDLLQSDLADTRILMLASFCWDRQLIALAAEKLVAELAPDSLIIAYSCHLDNYCSLQQIAQIPVQVSWNDCQVMFVYIKLKEQ